MDLAGKSMRDSAQGDERASSSAWRFAQTLLGNPIPSADAAGARRRAERERLEWLASISTEHESQLRALLNEEASQHDGRQELAEFVESLTGVACEWDASKHPRGAFSQNPGWFSPTSGSGGPRKASQRSHSPTANTAKAHAPGSSTAKNSGNFFDAIVKRNLAVADLTGLTTPGMVRSSRLAVDLDSASRLGGEVSRAGVAGLGTGGKAVVNGLANAIKNTVTLGLSDTQIELLAVTQDDRDRGYDSAVAIATASGEILIAVGTAGMTTALKGGGTLVRTASGVLTVFDAAGNVVGVIKGTFDAKQNGVNLSNGAQVAGGALGLSGNAGALKGLAASKQPSTVTPPDGTVGVPGSASHTRQSSAGVAGVDVDVDEFVARLPRTATPTV